MLNKKITVSYVLAIALAFSGCGGGSGSNVEESGKSVTDTTAPIFAANSVTNRSIEEGSGVDIATYSVSDDSPVIFTLEGEDAQDFMVISRAANGGYQATLKLKNSPDFEQKEVYHVTLVATDASGNRATEDVTVHVIDKPLAFNVVGNMGAVVAGSEKRLPLVVEEANANTTYSIAGANFTMDGDTVVFTAPAYVEGGNNTYIGIVTVDDGKSQAELTVKATVVKDANAKPETKNFLLKSRRDIDIDNGAKPFTDFTYTYDASGYLIEMVKTGTNFSIDKKTVFEYSDDHKIMKGYKEPGHKLQSIRVFADKKTEKTKVIADIDLRLSEDQYVNYMAYVQDTAALKNNRHLVKYIHGLEFGQRKVELYVYNNNDQLTRMITGKYTIGYDALVNKTDAELESANAPAGGFPSGDVRLSAAQLNSLKSGTLPMRVSHETTYVYDGSGVLKERRFFGYAEPKTLSDPVTVAYYANGVIKSITSNGVTIEYDTNSLLDKVTGYDYSYETNNDQTTVTVKHNGQTVTTYIFEEE